MTQILVTGGCGFIGRRLIARMLADGQGPITVLDNETTADRSALADLPVTMVAGDIRDAGLLDGILPGIEQVIHLAAHTRVTDSIVDPLTNFDINVVGSLTLLEAMRRHGVRHLVNASTGGAILGDAPSPMHENMVPRPLSPYGAAKLAVEGYASAYGGAYGFTCASLRFSNVYGPGSRHKGSVVAAFFKNILAGQPLVVHGDGSQVRDYVYIDDLCTGILQALRGGHHGVFQLGTGRATNLSELIDLIRATVGPDHDLTVIHQPFRAGEVHTTFCDIHRAATTFGYAPQTSLRQGLAQTWQWFVGPDAGN